MKGKEANFMNILLEGATLTEPYGFPALLPNSNMPMPTKLIAFDKSRKTPEKKEGYVHFYLEDHRFISRLFDAESQLERFKNYDGVIGPDPSIYLGLKPYLAKSSVFFNRLYTSYFQRNGINTVFNVRFGGPDTYDFCFSGIPEGSVIAIGTHGTMRYGELKETMLKGINEAIARIKPKRLLIYGTIPKEIVERHKEVEFLIFPSDASKAFRRRQDGIKEN